MGRLLAIVSAIVFTDAMLFGALIPLLPGFVDDFELSKLQAGLIFGAYGAGALLGGIPAGALAARIGPKQSVLAGLVALALASLAFALAGGPTALAVCRLAQGLASAMTWAGALAWIAVETPKERRGQALGTAFGAAVLGFIVGPMVGAVARLTSIRASFAVVAVFTLAVAFVSLTLPASRVEPRGPGALSRALGDGRFLAGLWLNLLPAFFFGVLDVLVPLGLGDAGWTPIAIAAVFVCAGLLETGLNPAIGRLSDSRGRLHPIRIALASSIVVAGLLAVASRPALVAVLVLGAALSFGGFYTPGMALVSDRAELAGLSQGVGFGVMNSAWAFGAMSGPSVGGALADSFGNAAPYLLCAVLCALTLGGIAARARPVRVV